MKKVLVTGSSGLIGSEVAAYFAARGDEIHGVDNNMRADFFGAAGDTRWNQQRLAARAIPDSATTNWTSATAQGVLALIDELQPDVLVHAAAQPSHDLAASRPFDDFDVNAVGTLNLLEAVRRQCAGMLCSCTCPPTRCTAMRPTSLPLVELPTRWDYADPALRGRHRRDFPHRSVEALAVRRLQARRRRHGAGVRPLLRAADLLPARRLPDRSEPFRRRAARFSQLSREGATSRAACTGSSGTRASRCGTTFIRTTSRASSGVHRRPALRRGLQPRRRAGQFVLHPGGVRR